MTSRKLKKIKDIQLEIEIVVYVLHYMWQLIIVKNMSTVNKKQWQIGILKRDIFTKDICEAKTTPATPKISPKSKG